MPGYWMNEQTGVLRPAVMAYLDGGPMTLAQVGAMRAYLRQWIEDPAWQGPNIDLLRATIGLLRSRRNIDSWLEVAEREGIDPL